MAQIALKFFKDKSITSNPFDVIQWDADGDLAYVPNDNGDWLVVPTGALQALDELAARISAVSAPTVELKSANFTAAYNFIYVTTGVLNVQLPVPTTNGLKITVIKTDASTLTFLRNGAELIHGIAANYSATSEKQTIELVSANGNYYFS